MENIIMWAKTAGGKAYTWVWKTVSCGQRRQAEKLTHRYGKQYHMGKDGRRKSLHTGMENIITWAKIAGEKAYKQYHVGKDGRRKSFHTGMENSIMWAKTAGGKAYIWVWKTVSYGQRRQAEKLTYGYGNQYHVGKDGRRKSLHTGMENSIMWAKMAGEKAYKQYHVGKDGRRKNLHTGMENSITWGKTAGGKAYTQVWKTVSLGQRWQAKKLTNSIMWAKTAGGKTYTRVWKTVSCGQRRQAKKLTHGYSRGG